MNDLPLKIEAILFVSTQPEKISKIAQVLKTSETEIKKAIQDLIKQSQNRGVIIIQNNDQVQLVSSPQYASEIARFQQKDLRENLSDLALETLTIIAYQGPVSRFKIEDIRGVNSTFVLRNLLRRGLIEKQKQGQKIQYQITTDFLRYLGLKNIAELPEYEQNKMKN